MPREVKISACQYSVREIRDFDDLAIRVRALLDQAAGSDIALFPELFTIELFTTLKDWKKRPISELVLIDQFTSAYKQLFQEEAKKRGQFIAGGSHLEEVSDGRFENIAHIFGPDGEIYSHTKTHIFPAEATWSTSEGSKMEVFQLPFAKVGFNVCYETEIPECSTSLVEQGAEIILTPSATFTEQGFWRVRHCAQARCIENQIYLVHCCLSGQPGAPLPNAWARSSVLGPCDLAWTNPAGIIAEAQANVETTVTGTVNLDLLYENRASGAAPTFKDRRRQVPLYRSWPSHVRT
ncbi:carbon-nitrogen hydrolase family protein [Agrobacterium tumefaciens]|uniref:carbon-nitrogen hydrolase family protein n=1 Tax=Agrobacterium tumefaciens TaxID=358 RepID=UPI00157229D4|nr:carbon-nitrogen hydrolase family protein [Agrobacterium tumefaciens]NSZ02074.1 carbon-nitrogen hydrolase family protein [Agrobacterium tumefaciens]NTB05701.1 carbon-nitrogen hydrolase family protein [Agrobacterium tumefaciens]NTB21800.1 carbon-nitrogen hydrolase family protein [Agrobacterium tumefaciens]NTB29546.1 carbon-nitrogen hydrolase family protein [Agrobacterium tumefaciens]NTB34526.1 carbon-nitrogen hydrolase family protein [Agrobacterium tumefaciens]